MISVCIATFNAGRYIQEQINSILSQLSEYDEIVVADDLSTDDTLNIIKKINDSRIKILNSDMRFGIIKNFERALIAAKGELVFLSDQDDIWLPNKVNECTKLLTTNLLVVTDCIVVDEKLNHLNESFFSLRNSKKGMVRNIYKNCYIGCCMAFRKELLAIALPFPASIPMHDVWLGLLAEVKGQVVFLPEKLTLYRRHDKNASVLKSNKSIISKLNLRIFLIANLMIRLVSVFLRHKKNFKGKI